MLAKQIEERMHGDWSMIREEDLERIWPRDEEDREKRSRNLRRNMDFVWGFYQRECAPSSINGRRMKDRNRGLGCNESSGITLVIYSSASAIQIVRQRQTVHNLSELTYIAAPIALRRRLKFKARGRISRWNKKLPPPIPDRRERRLFPPEQSRCEPFIRMSSIGAWPDSRI